MTATAITTTASWAGAQPHVVVIGAGIAGLTAALRLRRAGARVTQITKGLGGIQLGQGSIDILGYAPERVERPLDAISAFAAANPEHPYARIGVDAVRAGVDFLREAAGEDLLVGDPERNVNLPTAVGAVRPTALVTPTMTAGELHDGLKLVIIGVAQLKDFHPMLIAQNLERTTLPDGGKVSARAVMTDFEPRQNEYDATGLTFARALDDPKTRRTFAEGIKGFVNEGETVGLPAILGEEDHKAAFAEISQIVGAPVFEIPALPPCVPGMRLNEALVKAVKDARVEFILGTKVTGFTAGPDGRLASVTASTAGHRREIAADAFVLAAGGFESGALKLDSHGHVLDTVLGLPLTLPEGVDEDHLVTDKYWGVAQPLFKVGVAVDDSMKVVADGKPVYDNVYAAGGVIAGATRWQEKSGEGIALGSAVKATDAILASLPVVAASAASPTAERN
ncbi:glycerol-3-phosphate dehydrogenase subunit GlpB [Acidipropionibacterium jensenii]|uniref:glycerol-3-phosphate dehydrogenase subunit GlpB n=1 Tax=Acidipropionibacterium jensenii TaxID=1749 RepID=UPI000BC358A8|nr:glycerol-3-phosphate dehydrogenase subunit GlpB [Acidipropionibacterium jensenii]AZZ43043.1 glycerol-3-phosphate dehydrogenase subunit GlpB [Acidipropionibacterium jensenii]